MPTAEPERNPNPGGEPAAGETRAALTTLYERFADFMATGGADIPEDLRDAATEARDLLRRSYGPAYDAPPPAKGQVSGAGFYPPLYLFDASYPTVTKQPGPGYTVNLPLADGRTLFLRMGEAGRAALLEVFAAERRDVHTGDPGPTPAAAVVRLFTALAGLLHAPGDPTAKENAEAALSLTEAAYAAASAELEADAAKPPTKGEAA